MAVKKTTIKSAMKTKTGGAKAKVPRASGSSKTVAKATGSGAKPKLVVSARAQKPKTVPITATLPTPAAKKSAGALVRRVSPDERQRLIRETAFFIAESRGFSHGDDQANWFEAERRVDAQLRG